MKLIFNILSLKRPLPKVRFQWIVLLVALLSLSGLTLHGEIRRAVIVRPADAHRFTLEDDPTTQWQSFLRSFNIQSTIVDRNQLTASLSDTHLVVLHDIQLITTAEQEALMQFMRGGRNVIMTGRTGEATPPNNNTSFASRLGLQYRSVNRQGAAMVAEKRGDLSETLEERIQTSSSWWIVMDVPSRFTSDIPRMQRMSVESDTTVALSDRQGSIAFWLSGQLAKPNYEAWSHFPAVHHGEIGNGHYLWLGFNINQMGGDINSSEVFFRLMDNVMSHWHRNPVFELSPWPYPYDNAIIYSIDVEERFGNMEHVNNVEGLDAITYFILTFSAGLHENLLQGIGENSVLRPRMNPHTPFGSRIAIGRDIAVHGDNHDIFRGQPPERQRMRLQRTSDYIYDLTGKRPLGFRPPEEAYDFFTLQALVETGFEYVLGDNEPDRAEPQITRIGDHRLVQMAILNKDDVNLVVQAGRPDPKVVLQNYKDDVDSIFKRGGLYVVNIHSQILAVEQYLPVFADLVKYTNAKETWTVNGSAMHDWWLRRDNVTIEILQQSSTNLRLRVHNRGNIDIENLALNIWKPKGAGAVRVESPAGGRRITDFRTESERLMLQIPLLLAEESIEYSILWRD
jgi:peptidoglycan/xylan/chitin deacetylase (PgdA/CDA1 family)